MRHSILLAALTLLCCSLWAQESHVHRNIGLDSLMILLQQNSDGQVYYVKDAGAANLVFNMDLNVKDPAKAIRESLEKKGYSISEYNNDLYILKGLGLEAALPKTYFKIDEASIDAPAIQKDDKAVQYKNILSKNIKEATGGSKVYQIGDKREIRGTDKVYLNGYIRSYMTGEPVVGVTVYDSNSKAIAQSDAHGFYRIYIPTGTVTLDVLGFSLEDTKINLQVYNNGSLDIIVREKVFALNEVIVSSEEVNKVKSTSLGLEKVRIKALQKVPVVLGEADVVKVLLTLPGVKQTGEASNGFNVRGGAVDQNLVLFNGGTVYNPSHLFGLFSGFNPDIINDVELYKCSIPVEYGGRISSVLDINSRQGNNKNLTGSVSAGLLTTKAHIEGPIGKKTTFIAGTRITYSDWLLKLLPQEKRKRSDFSYDGYGNYTLKPDKDFRNGSASFMDITAGLSHHFNGNNSIHLNGYMSQDKFRFKLNTRYAYDNLNGSIKWRSNFNDKNLMEIAAGYDKYNYLMSDFSNAITGYDMRFDIEQTFGKLKLKSALNDAHTLVYGANFTNYNLMPGSYMPYSSESLVIPRKLENETGMEGAIFIGDTWNLSDKLTVDYGTRVSMFKSDKTYVNPEIRLSGRYLISDNWSVKGGFNSMTQYIHMLSNTVSVSPTDTWKLSDKDIKPQTGWQLAAGVYTTTGQHNIDISIEAYYKRMKNYLDFKSGATLLMNPNVADDVVRTQGKAYGIELMAAKPLGKLNGWASYTWSRSQLREVGDRGTSAINRGNWYNSSYDKPHEFKVAGNYKFTHRINVSVNIDYATGRPTTVPVARYFYNYGYRLYYTERNTYRVPDYFRVDMALNIEPTHRIKAFTHFSFTIGVYNVTGKKNTYSIYYEGSATDVHGYQMCVFGTQIPYINLNFKF